MSSHSFESSFTQPNKTTTRCDSSISPQRHRASQKFLRTSLAGSGAGGSGNGAFLRHDDESPPPAPPVRDSSSLGSIKYGPGHEKYPSWPVPAAASTLACSTTIASSVSGGGSTRSKSWTDHTNYPKEKLVQYTRPYMKGQHAQHMEQKLKTVMERCEKIPPQAFESRPYSDTRFPRQKFHLPNVDHDGKSVDDIDYVLPSPPERDLSKYHLTQKNLKSYGREYEYPSIRNKFSGDVHKLTESDIKEFMEYTKDYDDSQFGSTISSAVHHQTQISYAQSEGYHSYVSSTDSSTCTPFLDRLRLDNESAMPSSLSRTTWNDGGSSINYGDICMTGDRRDSVVTRKSDGNETLIWRDSMSDISSVVSSGTSIHHSDQFTNPSSKQLIVHSARVQIPQKHHSESVLYINGHNESYKSSPTKKDNGNKNKLKLFPITTYSMQEQKSTRTDDNGANTSISNKDNKNRFYSSFQLSKFTVAERVNEFEMQQQKYSYLDPNKKHKVPDPTLKAIQKKALLSFYERHQQNDCKHNNNNNNNNKNKNTWKSEPQLTHQLSVEPLHNVTASPVTTSINKTHVSLPSRRASSASDYASVNNSKRHGLALSLESKTTDNISNNSLLQSNHQTISSATIKRSCDSLSMDSIGPTIQIDNYISEIPPERPPKNPNLKMAFSHLYKNTVHTVREPSPDLPLPSPPIVSENEVIFDNETPLPPPPTESILNWKQQFNNNNNNNNTRNQIKTPHTNKGSYSRNESYRQIMSPNQNNNQSDILSKQPVSNNNLDFKRPLIHSQNLNTTNKINSRNVTELLPSKKDIPRAILENDYKENIIRTGSNAKKIPNPYFSHFQHNNYLNSSSTKSPVIGLLRKSSFKSNAKISTINSKNNNFPPSPPLCANSTPITTLKSTSLPITKSPTMKTLCPSQSVTSCNLQLNTSLSSNLDNSQPATTTTDQSIETTQSSSKLSLSLPSSTEPTSLSFNSSENNEEDSIPAKANGITTNEADDVAAELEKEKQLALCLLESKLPEEIDCDAFSEEFINHLPSSDRLKDLLVPGPKHKKPIDYVEDLFKIDINRQRRIEVQFKLTSLNSSLPNNDETTKSISLLSNSSPYFTTSEPKAKMLTKCNQDINQCPTVVTNAKDLNQKKRELVNRLDKKLQVLKKAALALSEECQINDELGVNVKNYINELARPQEISKYQLHVEEVGKITSLLLSLSGRLARAENALMNMVDEHLEKSILETKRDKLLEQLEEAKKLKECIDKRSVMMSNLLHTYLNPEKYSDYDHFINMKTKLIIDSKEISDKIKLGEEQLNALKEIPII